MLEKIKNEIELFKLQNDRYPTSYDFNNTNNNLPNTKYIERKFGGLKKLRKTLGYKTTDFTSGQERITKAYEINSRDYNLRWDLYHWLVEKFEKVNIHMEEQFSQSNHRCDYAIYHQNKVIYTDIFFGYNIKSTMVCANYKMKKYITNPPNGEVILISMNQDISQEELDKKIKSKKNKLPPHIKLISIMEFKKYCGIITL